MPLAAIDHFDSNLAYVRNLLALGRALDEATTEAVDTGDIQRAAIVMAVSAMDHYVHEKARQGMLEALHGDRVQTPAFQRFSISLSATLAAVADPSNDDWLDQAIRDQHGHQPFLKTEQIADAMRLISTVQLWDAVAACLGESASEVKTRVKLVVGRRNKIAHEADLDPTQPGVRWPIAHQDATEAVDYVESVVRAIEAAV